jgi:hypothetical protein
MPYSKLYQNGGFARDDAVERFAAMCAAARDLLESDGEDERGLARAAYGPGDKGSAGAAGRIGPQRLMYPVKFCWPAGQRYCNELSPSQSAAYGVCREVENQA